MRTQHIDAKAFLFNLFCYLGMPHDQAETMAYGTQDDPAPDAETPPGPDATSD